MLEKFGWKPGQGLGKEESGIADPLWIAPREGKCGLFTEEEGRPKKPDENAPEELARPFVPEGYQGSADSSANGKKTSAASSGPRPNASTLVSTVLGYLTRQDGQ